MGVYVVCGASGASLKWTLVVLQFHVICSYFKTSMCRKTPHCPLMSFMNYNLNSRCHLRIFKSHSARVKKSKCWLEHFVMYEPVGVCSWALLSSLLRLSLTILYSCSPPPNMSALASSLLPQLPPSNSAAHNMNM